MNSFPSLPPQAPSRGTLRSRQCLKYLFTKHGWSFDGQIPNIPQAVAILIPHTSNLDGWYGLLGLLGLGIKINILMKNTLFKTPLKPLLKAINAIPIQRNINSGFTEQAINQFKNNPCLWLGLAPEGTRAKTDHLRTGFYQIAIGAHVPIVMFSLNYKTKSLTCLGQFNPTGHYYQDLEKILAYYQGNFYPKRLENLSTSLKNML